jgi:hypothetical protein
VKLTLSMTRCIVGKTSILRQSCRRLDSRSKVGYRAYLCISAFAHNVCLQWHKSSLLADHHRRARIATAYVMEYIVSVCRRPEEVAEGDHGESGNQRTISGTARANRHGCSLLTVHARVLAVVHGSGQHLRLHNDDPIESSCRWWTLMLSNDEASLTCRPRQG